VLENGIVELHGDYGLECLGGISPPYGLAAQQEQPPDTYMVTAYRPQPNVEFMKPGGDKSHSNTHPPNVWWSGTGTDPSLAASSCSRSVRKYVSNIGPLFDRLFFCGKKVKAGFWLLVMIILVATALLAWIGRESLLREAADLWIVSDHLTHADAIVVLGGNSQTRPPIAAELYRRGLAKKVLVSYPSDYQLNLVALLKLGVPANAIETFGKANTNTREEAVALREWAERNAASAFVIPTEALMARRVRWIFYREFSDRAVTIAVRPFDPPDYSLEEWWKTERGVMAFKSEILKYFYYRWSY
jgi:uncharacterized SAM-binding protein YcdF (DUF218 family)